MSSRSLTRRATTTVAAVASAALVLTGCGSDESGSPSSGGGDASRGGSAQLPTVEADEALAAMVPAEIAEDGVISVGSDTTYAPSEFLDEDGETIIGFDVDLFTLVGQKLGLKVQFETAPFDNIIAGTERLGFSWSDFPGTDLSDVQMLFVFSRDDSVAAWAQLPGAVGDPCGGGSPVPLAMPREERPSA